MQWFVQTPQYSFKGTFSHRRLVVVFLWDLATREYTRFHAQWCACGACCFKSVPEPIYGISDNYMQDRKG